jgi:hypothetical protein
MTLLDDMQEAYGNRETRPLTIRARRVSKTGDATALIESIYRSARAAIEEMATRPGDEQVTADYIMGVADDLSTETDASGEVLLTFVFKDFGSLCPLGARACRHWFELAFTQIDLADHARRAGFALAEEARELRQVLVTPSPLTYLGKVLVACEKNADGSFDIIADDGCDVPEWSALPPRTRKAISSLSARSSCACSLCKALAR